MRQNSRRSNSKEPREPPSRDSRETMSGPGCCEAHELTLEEIQNITVVQEAPESCESFHWANVIVIFCNKLIYVLLNTY